MDRSEDPNFKQLMEDCRLIDLPLHGGEFTWSSTRFGGLWSTIDRWVINDVALLFFNGAVQTMAEWSCSDHRALILTLGSSNNLWKEYKVEESTWL